MQLLTCQRYKAKLTTRGCKLNQEVAKYVFLKLVAYPQNGVKLSDFKEHEIDRFVTCGDCPQSEMQVPVDLIQEQIRESVGFDLSTLIKRGEI